MEGVRDQGMISETLIIQDIMGNTLGSGIACGLLMVSFIWKISKILFAVQDLIGGVGREVSFWDIASGDDAVCAVCLQRIYVD